MKNKLNKFILLLTTITASAFLSTGCGKQSSTDPQTTAPPSVPVQATNKKAAVVSPARPTTPDQIFTCRSSKWGEEEFVVNFGAKTVKSDMAIVGAGKPFGFDMTDVIISDDSISFVQSLNQDLGGVVLVLKKHVTINRKDGTFTTTDQSDNSATQGTWTSAEAKTP
jgi:hypothetical protein